jgi:glycogen(starch) synthase
MKLLIYSHVFAPQVGGIETFVMDLAREFTRPDHEGTKGDFEVTVVTQTPGVNDAASSEATFQVVRKPGPKKLWGLIAAADRVLLAGPAILPLLFALIQRKRPIVVHQGYQSICPNGMLFHLPTQRSCPGHFAARRYWECIKCNLKNEKTAGSTRLLFLAFVRRALARLADSNVGASQHVSGRIALPRGRVICNGVPDTLGARNTVTAIPRGAICFAYVGRLVTEKGVDVLVEAAGILKQRGCDFHLLIIGDGPEREALQLQAASVGLARHLEFLGFLTGTRLQEALNGVSASIMPSIWEDVAPFSALEQMMQGRLLIGSRIGGVAEEIGDAGLTFTPGNARELAERMQEVIEEPELISQLGRQARERALQSYTLERMISEYRNLVDPE